MDKQVVITLNISQEVDDEREQFEFVTMGKYYEKNNKKYITYEESKMTGLEGFTTTLRLDDDKITMTRFGTPNTQMIFQQGKTHTGFYATAYGGLTVGVSTSKINTHSTENSLDIELDYHMEFGNHMPTYNSLYIKVREA